MIETETVFKRTKVQDALMRITSDIDNQPAWRDSANRACAYYDGDQLDSELIAKLKERGQPITMHNLVGPTIDGVLGMEAKTRTDLMVVADDPTGEFNELAEAINAEFHKHARLSRLDKARSDAYASEIKAGLGFVEVYRNPNLFGSKYKVIAVPRSEVFWDWYSVEDDWSDCRWVMRERWIDVDEAKSLVPSKASIIELAANQWEQFIYAEHIQGQDPQLFNAYNEFATWSRSATEWLTPNRDRIRLQIIYFRKYERKLVIEMTDGSRVLYDKDNVFHVIAVAKNKVKLIKGQISYIEESWFAGPHHLGTKRSDAPGGKFPIVPFWGFRKDKSGEPYGLVHRAMPAQDEVNFRRIRLTWLLNAKRVVMDKDATDMSTQKVLEEVERGDGLITLNPDRRNKKTIAEAFQVQQDFNIAAQQFQVMQDSMKLIQDTMGVYSSFLGQDSSASSGVAIANLVEQGSTTLAEINDNYAFATQQVGELLLGYIIEDLTNVRDYEVSIKKSSTKKATIVTINQTGEGKKLTNDVSRFRSHIALAPIQQTSAYKSQLAERMVQMTAQLPPNLQMSVMDLVLELSDIPNKEEFLERIRGEIGISKNIEDMSEEEQAAHKEKQQQEQQQMELAMQNQMLAMQELAGKVEKLQSEAQRNNVLAQKEAANVSSMQHQDTKTQAETALILEQMQRTTAEVEQLRQQIASNLDTQIQSIADSVQL